jgi:hypothetical protein
MAKGTKSERAEFLDFLRSYLDMRRCQRNYLVSRQPELLEDCKRRMAILDKRAEDELGLNNTNLFDFLADE